MQPYGKLELFGKGIWVRDGEWYDTVFRRRMTVMALFNGDILVHHAFILKEEDLAHLNSLGKVVGIIMPNALHGDEVKWMAEKLPSARIYVPSAVASKVQKKHRVDGTLEKDWPREWSADVECMPVQGLRFVHESVFFHKVSRTLILTDLVFNMEPQDFKGALERKVMAWNRVGTGFGPSRLCDGLFTKDLDARLQSVQKMLSRDFDRVIMNHGRVVTEGGKAMMQKAFGV